MEKSYTDKVEGDSKSWTTPWENGMLPRDDFGLTHTCQQISSLGELYEGAQYGQIEV